MSVSLNLQIFNAILFSSGIIALQAAANLLNSFCDFENGLDKPETAGDRTIVDELVTRKEFPFLFLSVIAVWFISFISTLPSSSGYLTHYLVVYTVGLGISVLYSAGSPPLKYIGFGDIAVFLAFGPLLVVAAALSCARDGPLVDLEQLILATTPAAILVVAILHANNHRDIKVDAMNSAKTISVRLGKTWSKYYYDALVLMPGIISGIIAYLDPRLHGLVAGLVVVPLSVRLCALVNAENVPRDIDAETAKVMLLYGLSAGLGVLVTGF
jgi:1,4-dihydroxy-2-naphthoate octaprenyltransferase